MSVVYALYDLANMVGGFGSDLIVLGSNILGVYLIGSYLGIPIITMGSRIIILGSRINNAANAFENVYNDIRNGAGLHPLLERLMDWADAIIDFIANKDHFITSIVRAAFNGIDRVLFGTYQFILPHVLQIIYNNFPFLRSLITWLTDTLNSIIPNFAEFRYNPVQWVINRLKIYSAALGRFLSDPDGYIKEKLYIFFPNLKLFLENPSDYIIDKFGEKIEIFAQRYLMRLVKIVENAINDLF